MPLLKRPGQHLRSARDHHQMHVVRHQAIAYHRQLVQANGPTQQIEIHHALGGAGQNELTSIATLCYVMRNIDDNHPRETRHDRYLGENMLRPRSSVPESRPSILHEQAMSYAGLLPLSSARIAKW